MKNNEEELQAECITAACQQFPKMSPTITANYNNVGAGVERGRASRMVSVEISKGLKPGEPDLTVYYKKRTFGIELKTDTGSLSKNQKAFIPFLQKQDIPVFLIRNVESFLKVLKIIENITDEGIVELINKNTPHLIPLMYEVKN